MEKTKLSSVFVAETEHGLVEIDAEAYRISRTRRIPLKGEITPESVEWVIRQCDLLLLADPDEPITLVINSLGGQLSSAYHLIDYIKGSGASFFGLATEICASAAAQIFAAIPKGHRVIMPHGTIIIHRPLTSSSLPVNSGSVAVLTDVLHRTEDIVFRDLAEWTGHTVNEIADACEKETRLCGHEAIDYGIADELYSARKMKEMEVLL